MVSIQKNIYQLRRFRKRFGGELNDNHLSEIFGVDQKIKEKIESNESIWERKIFKAESYVKDLLFLDWVKYIAVTGSVAAEVARDEDDIDVFVVVKNDRKWLYRGLMMINPRLGKLSRRANKEEEKDSLCLNLICEERGVKFDNDIFNFHELYFMKSIYNSEYKDFILSKNLWVKEFGGVLKKRYIREKGSEKRNLFLLFIDSLAFLTQYLFMVITKHNPEYNRLVSNNRKGRIEFFMSDFKTKILN